MKSFRTALVIAGLATGVAGLAAQQPAFKRTVLQQVDLSIPGKEVVTAHVEIPTGVNIGRHTHFGEEIGYVIEGSMTVELEGVDRIVKAGDAFLIPMGKVHDAKNTSGATVRLAVNYVVDKGKPLATPAK
jgi:quercetin dioxygenase-like cupin family protein